MWESGGKIGGELKYLQICTRVFLAEKAYLFPRICNAYVKKHELKFEE